MSKSRKPKSKLTAAPPTEGGIVSVERPATTSLDDLRRQAERLVALQDWGGLLALGKTPLTAIDEAQRAVAEDSLLLLQVRGLSKDHLGLPPGANYDTKNELNKLTLALASRDDNFSKKPEFGVFVKCLGYDFEDCYQGFRHLTRACADYADMRRVSRLRGCGLRLMDPHRWFDSVTETEHELLKGLPEIDMVLSDAYASLEASEAASTEDQLMARVFRLEMSTRMADPWDYERVAREIRSLPTPSVADLRARYPNEDPTTGGHHLLPSSWAFLWELQHASAVRLGDLLARYESVELGNVLFEGLRHIVRSISGKHDCDTQFLQGLHFLMESLNGWTGWLGDCITLSDEQVPVPLPFSYHSLELPTPSDLLMGLAERAPESFPRHAELLALARVYGANENFAPLEDEDDSGADMPGLDWLCTHSISFHFAAAYAVEGDASRMKLFLQAVRKCAEDRFGPPVNYFSGDLSGEAFTLEDVQEMHVELEVLARERAGMSEQLMKMWRQEVGNVFAALSTFEGESRKKTLELARLFVVDLLDAGQSFRLGYLEQVAGDRDEALRYYLVHLAEAKELPEPAIGNMKLLWATCDDLEEVSTLVATLEERRTNHPRADTVVSLLGSAKVREAVLERQDQFERTAVNRWPTLTAPARKLLGVLSNINSYTGFRELGEYGGMPEDWAQRHYRKLVELGMVVETKTGYRINAHIQPLLEREGQHSVIGRIVRAQGTSAVKQVFNSQREYSIYQVMVQLCPNHLVFPNSSLQSIMSFDRMKELVDEADFGYYLRASVDMVVVSSTTFLPMLAIEVDSVWHDTEKQQTRDDRKDRLFAAAGVPFMRLRPVGSPSEEVIRGQVAEHLDELVRTLRTDIPGYEQARALLEDLSQ